MPLRITYLEDGGIILTGEGVVTGSEIKAVNVKIYKSPEETRKIAYQLCNFEEMTDVSVSNTELEEIAMQDQMAFENHPHMLLALVVKEDFHYGMSRMWEAQASETRFETMVFRDMEEAQQWIKRKLKKE